MVTFLQTCKSKWNYRLCNLTYIYKWPHNNLVSRGQTTISAQGVIACSISARAEKGLVSFLLSSCSWHPWGGGGVDFATSLVSACNALFQDGGMLREEGATGSSTAVEFWRRVNVHIDDPGSRTVKTKTGNVFKTYYCKGGFLWYSYKGGSSTGYYTWKGCVCGLAPNRVWEVPDVMFWFNSQNQNHNR